jgi:tetratricopeptide (TPR) repeat protein
MSSDAIDMISEARLAWKAGDSAGAIDLLGDPILNENEEANFLAGEIYYSSQEWGAALNCFRHCLRINPDFGAAQTYIDLIFNILGFFHTDQFNP